MESNYELKKQNEAADIEYKKAQVDNLKKTSDQNEYQKNIDAINSLLWLAESVTIDSDNTILASEPKFRQTFNDQEQDKIKKKIFQLIDKL